MLAAVISGGAIGASAIPAMAADSTGSSSSTQATNSYGAGGQRGPHQANGKTEEVLTGDTATKVEAAVKAAQPDATIERMETDADGATYEAHITKADGTRALSAERTSGPVARAPSHSLPADLRLGCTLTPCDKEEACAT